MPDIKAIVAAVCLLTTAATAQDTVSVPIDQAAGIATQALFAGDTQLAVQIAQAVLQERPDDRAALLVVAVGAPRLGDPATGRRAGARAWAVSTTNDQKYEAARLTALAAANEERYTLATFWLRRALTVVPNDEERTRTINDARGVSRLNPWSTQLSFSLVPSNNVNGGAESEDSSAPGNPTGGTLSEDALALKGWRASWGLSTSYRLHQSEDSRTTVGLSYRGGRVWLTEEGTEVPDEAFDTASVDVSLTYLHALENGTASLRASRGVFTFRDLDLDGDDTTVEFDQYETRQLQLGRQFALSDTTQLSLSARREWLDYLSDGIGDVTRSTVSAGFSTRLQNGNRIGVNLSYIDSVGEDNVNYTSDIQSISANYSWAEPLGAISLSMGAGLRWSNYPDYRLIAEVTGGRQDETVFYSANVGFPEIEYAGFSPGLRFDWSATESNVSRFDRTTYSLGLTISSSF